MHPKLSRLLLFAFVAALAGCSRCGKTPTAAAPGGLSAHVPKDAQGVVFLPDLARTGSKLTKLQGMTLANFAAQLQGFPSAKAYVDAVVAQAGVDPRAPDSLKAAGLAPEKGLALVELGAGRSVLVVGVSDKKTLEAWLSKQAQRRLGAKASEHRTVEGVEETVFPSQSGTPLLALAYADDFAIIARGPAIASLPALAHLAPESSLAKDVAFQKAVAALPSSRDVFGWAPPRSPLLDPKTAADGGAFSADLTDKSLDLRFFFPRPNAPNEVKAFEKVDADDDLLAQLPPTSVVRARAAVDFSRFAGIWQRYVPARINFALSAAGVDVDKQVLGNLKPGAVLQLSVAPTAQLGAGLPSLDVSRTNPFRYLQLSAQARVKDPKQAAQVIDQVAQNAPKFRAKMTRTELQGSPAWLTRYAQGEGADLALVGDTLLVGGPQESFEAALSRMKAKPKATPLPYEDALKDPAVGMVVDLHQLAESVRALPSSAWGLGGFAIKATTLRWLDALHELSALTLGVSGKDGGLSVAVSLRFERG